MIFHETLEFLADFGDSAVLIAVVFSTAFYLLWCQHHNEALALVASLILAAGAIAGLKLILLSCGAGYFDIYSPSGHAAMSISVYGVFGLILSSYFKSWRRQLIIFFFFALGLIIAVSRVIMNLHSAGEVVLGIIVGIAIVAAIRLLLLKRSGSNMGGSRHFSAYIIMAIIVIAGLSLHGTRLPAEMFIQKTAGKIKSSLSFCN